MTQLKYTREVLEEAARHSKNLADILRHLGVRSYSGGMSNYIRDRLTFFQIDTAHFAGCRCHKGQIRTKKSWKLVLVYNDRYREHGRTLRRALIESGVPYVCSKCGCPPEWEGTKLVLEVDHIDGNWANNVRENLRFLCPNCHSQAATSSNSGYVETNCLQCGNPFQARIGRDGVVSVHYCKPSCRLKGKQREQSRKGTWPGAEGLKKLVWSMPVQKAAKLIGVSGSAVKGMCRRLGIETPPRGYWTGMPG